MDNILKKRQLYLINGFIGFLFLGICNAWGIFVVPLETAYEFTRTQTSLAYSISIACFSLGAIIVGAIGRRISYKWLVRIAGILIGVGLFLTGFMDNIVLIYITYSVLAGTGIGMGYACIISSVPTWFPEKSGTISGVLLMGYALSTAIFGTLINMLLNSVGISMTFKILGVLSLIMIIACSFNVLIPTVQQLELLPQPKINNSQQSREMTTSQMLKSPIFYIHFLIICCVGGAGLAIINHASPILTEEMLGSAGFAATIVSVNSIINGMSRLGWGVIFDKIGMIKTMFAAFVCGVIGGILLMLSMGSKQTFLFVLAGFLIMVAFGGNATLLPSTVRALYGNANFAMNYSIYNLNALVCSMVPTVVGSLQVASSSYTLPSLLILVLEAIGVGLLLLFITIYKKTSN